VDGVGNADVTLRPLAGRAEMEESVRLQRTTWGADFHEVVPPAVLWVAQQTGGVASGAFAGDGRLLGFVFGITGVRNGRLVHWSDMLAVHPDARGRGLGLALKLHQRELLLERGIEVVNWTFDPLEARNAHLNFRRLGIVAREYLRDVYANSGSDLHAGIGTDRLLAEWWIGSRRVADRIGSPAAVTAAPEAARIAVPLDIQRLKHADPDGARAQRSLTRAAFEDYLGRGWVVVDAERRDDRLEYVLVPSGVFIEPDTPGG
jgi:predicted GNAT superfamily acetyltransferase